MKRKHEFCCSFVFFEKSLKGLHLKRSLHLKETRVLTVVSQCCTKVDSVPTELR